MIKALLHKKLKNSFENPEFKPSEDSLTSSVIGLLQYLPNEKFWCLLKNSCGNLSSFKQKPGELISIEFWKKFQADKKYNSTYVEPDVYCEFENINVIIEAKKEDAIEQQYSEQWEKEITSYFMEQNIENSKELIFIALGGNKSLKNKTIDIKKKKHNIYMSSWQRLLSEVEKYRDSLTKREKYSSSELRILTDTIHVFEKHNYFCLNWLDEIVKCDFSKDAFDIINNWSFDNKPLLSSILNSSINYKISTDFNTFSL